MDEAEESGHVQKAQRGDRQAFLLLLRHYQRPLYRLAFALARDVGAATSITLDAVLKAKEGVRFMAEGRLFFPWVAGIVRNRARSRRRPDVPLVSARAPRVAPGVVELADRLLEAVDNLEPDEQAVLVLRIAEQLPPAVIETVLQVTPGSARSLLAQSRARLTAQMRSGKGAGETHLTPDQLSAQLDGTLEGDSSDRIRHHLAGCEECRLQCMRMASADDVLRALLVHDPEDSFHEALIAFLEEEYNAKHAAGWIPPQLESAIAAESARLEERRWSDVSLAVPAPFVLPASAVRPLDGPPAMTRATAPAGAVGGPGADAVRRRGPDEMRRNHPVLEVAEATPLAAPAPTAQFPAAPAAARTAPPARRDGATLLVGAALAAVLVLLAGLYLGRWNLGSRPGGFRAPALRHAASIADPKAPQAPPWISRSEATASRIAIDSSAMSNAPAEKRSPATVPAAIPAEKATVTPAPRAPAAATVTPAPGAPRAATSPAAAPVTAKEPVPIPARPVTGSTSSNATPAPGSTERPAAPRRAADDLGILCGRVRDESGAPIVRAQVLLADLQLGAVTDRNGRFCLSAPIGARTVSVVALGFTTQRRVVTIGGRTPELAVTLRSAAVRESSRVGNP